MARTLTAALGAAPRTYRPRKSTSRGRAEYALFGAGMALLAAGCSDSRNAPMFELLPPDRTGIHFENTITTNDSINIQTDVYIYNGAGVAVGDIDNDGLPDLYFTGNMVSSRLYRNKGGMRFEDITESAGVGTSRWASGASMVDINNDGRLDIHVSVSGPEWSKPQDRRNLLFINNGDRTFTESAERFALADTGFTIHAAFFDYDRDGCLDVFLLNNSPRDFSRAEAIKHPSINRGDTPGSHNQLYRNSCLAGAATTATTFTNISERAGIERNSGYGLGVAIGDLDNDGWPDIYVSNDAMPSDVIYVNNGDGTFTDKASAWLKHSSYAGMGVDIADFNDDGWADIVQVDMMPPELAGRKRMSGYQTYSRTLDAQLRGFRLDYSINTLQLSNGVGPSGDVVFSEISRLAGVAYTNWSWSALFADFDNDGRKDIFISNGYPKQVNDLDYQNAAFAARRNQDTAAGRRASLEVLERLRAYDLPNHLFRNNGDLTFTDRATVWGLDQPSLSYGAAYADLDNDGALDLVVNNIDAPAFVYRNRARDFGGDAADRRHYLQVRLETRTPHRGIGAKVAVTAGGHTQHVFLAPHRGYMSSVDNRAHFGLGATSRVDSLEIVWPDGRRQVLANVPVDTLLVVKDDGKGATTGAPRNAAEKSRVFEEMPAPAFRHQSFGLVDYGVQPLLPYMISRQGPALAAGDVNGDGLDDLYTGGNGGSGGTLWIQQRSGHFTAAPNQPWNAEKAMEDWGAAFFDANGDGRLDLYVASGGYHASPTSRLLQDRLYLNRNGQFERDTAALPVMLTSTGTVRAGDFTGDGKPDVFVGGRVTPRRYPFPTRSYLLRNESGRFVDVTAEVAPELSRESGMITDATWIDFNRDGRLDLVTAGEWTPIRFYRNDGTRFTEITSTTKLPPLRGWWYSLAAGDFDADGDLDLVAGNLGLNHSFTASTDSTLAVYAAEFTGNQTTDVILTKEIDGVEYPVHGLVPLGRDIYPIGLRFPTYGSFANVPMKEVLSETQLTGALRLEADTFASMHLRNNGDGTFTAISLPNLAQIAPIRGIVPHDVDNDGALDVIVAGNIYDFEPNTPRADAGNGLWLRNDGKGNFAPVAAVQSGLLAPGNVSGLALIRMAAGRSLVVANTGDSLQVFAIRPPSAP